MKKRKDKKIRLLVQESQYLNNRSSKKKKKMKRMEVITEKQNLPRIKGYKFPN